LFPYITQIEPDKQTNRVDIVSALRNKKLFTFIKKPLQGFFYVYPIICLLALLFDRLFPQYSIESFFVGIFAIVLLAEALLFGFFGLKVKLIVPSHIA